MKYNEVSFNTSCRCLKWHIIHLYLRLTNVRFWTENLEASRICNIIGIIPDRLFSVYMHRRERVILYCFQKSEVPERRFDLYRKMLSFTWFNTSGSAVFNSAVGKKLLKCLFITAFILCFYWSLLKYSGGFYRDETHGFKRWIYYLNVWIYPNAKKRSRAFFALHAI